MVVLAGLCFSGVPYPYRGRLCLSGKRPTRASGQCLSGLPLPVLPRSVFGCMPYPCRLGLPYSLALPVGEGS